MDIYRRHLSSQERILLYLKEKLNHNVDICKYILNKKKEDEKKEIKEWYNERWENIAGVHYIIHNEHCGKFSLIFDDKNYIVKPDHNMSFYNRTGISYQIIELIHVLIKIKDKECLKYDDYLYTLLSKKITEKMISIYK